MDIRELTREDASSVVALWTEAGLTRPWNDATADFHRALDGATSAVLGLTRDDQLMGAVMVGHDGHRGWVYYLAVAKAHQRSGVGSELMGAAEDWLRRMGAVKLQLMVRSENESVLDFYERIGYETSDVRVVSRWL
ncbi:MAG: GNAT family acetyltransferase [Acidobacteriota bacterium]|nr:GNAT family acetyltransferase [Acidobacteriota bacterium]MDE3031004.1 GNAT family acetyltransferase [Acidobacteriota bacterium]MDE3139152.1 GNAT family acetyltransferase [Acidobacteriota bacterium]